MTNYISMCSLLPAKQSFLITVLHRQLVATSMEFLARYIVIHDVYEVDNVSIRFTFIVGNEKPFTMIQLAAISICVIVKGFSHKGGV